MDAKLYYTPPSDLYFRELKARAMEIWKSYDDEFGYATEKVNQIKNIQNIKDNFMYMVAMFDIQNQAKLSARLSDGCKKEVRDRMIDGGQPIEFIVF